MPFCPNCRCEYSRGVKECPDCRSQLVDSLPPAEPRAQPDFTEVELCTVHGEIPGKLLQGVLARNGIPSRLAAPLPLSPFFGVHASIPIGGGHDAPFRIMVNRPDLARAKQLYDDYERNAGYLEEVPPSEEEQP